MIKTHKLFVGGAFPRSESGRSRPVEDAGGAVVAHVCRASRKDLRDAVRAARGAQPGWADRSAYNRGQILYRMAEMLEGQASVFADALVRTAGASQRAAAREVSASVDRLVAFSGWADKFQSILGGQAPVAGPYHVFTLPEATGVCVVVCPDLPSLLGLVTLVAPPLCAGNAVVAIGSSAHPLPTSLLGEGIAASDVPPGALNLLTGDAAELAEHVAGHRDVDAVHAADLDADLARTLRRGAAEDVKRVTIRDLGAVDVWHDPGACHHPWWIEPFVEMKTIWHPAKV